nr:putative late blight resistance protein homolog R1B-14 [Ipomoea batatas]
MSYTMELASKNERAKYALKDMVEKIRNLVSDAEHAICMYTVERVKHTTTTSEAKCTRAFNGEIQSIRDRVKKIREDHDEAVKVLIYNAPITGTYVSQLAGRLGQVVSGNVSKEIYNLVDGLLGDMENFDEYLRLAWRNPMSNDSDVLKNVVAQIRNVVMEVEDAICKYTVEKKEHKDKGWPAFYYYSRFSDSAKEMKAMRDRVREIQESNAAALQVLIYNNTPITDTYAIHLAGRLGEVMEENVWLLKEIKNQVDGLLGDIKYFDPYLKLGSRNQRSYYNDVENKIRDVVMEAEDAICKYTVEKKNHRDKGWLRYFESRAYHSRITDSAKEIKAIRDRIKNIRGDNTFAFRALIDDHGEAQPAITPPMVRPTNHSFCFLNIKFFYSCDTQQAPNFNLKVTLFNFTLLR